MKHSCPWFLLSTLFLCLFTPAKASAQYNHDDRDNRDSHGQTITCESQHNRFRYCPVADPQSEVVMVQQLGNKQCVRGQTWGNDSGGIWVDKGCRAQFQLNRSHGDGPTWWNSSPGHSPHNRSGSGACFFKNTNFTGDYFCSPRGSNVRQVPLDDEITSIQIYGHATVTIYKDPGFNGPNAATDRSIQDLHRWRMPNNPNLNWDNRISSARVD